MIAGDRLLPGIYEHFAGFARIDNFADNRGSLVAVSNELSLLHANTIIKKKYIPGTIKRLEIKDREIILDNETYPMGQCQVFDSGFIYPFLNFQTLQNQIKTFLNQNKKEFPKDSLLFLLAPEIKPDTVSSFDKLLQQEFEKAFSFFIDDFFESTRRFRSIGKGLTPAGDDFIAGVLYGIDCLESISKSNYSDIKIQLTEIAENDNLFSRNMQHLAKEARYFKRLQDFLAFFFSKGVTNETSPFRQLIRTGDTSGADLLTGFFAVLLHKPYIFEQSRK